MTNDKPDTVASRNIRRLLKIRGWNVMRLYREIWNAGWEISLTGLRKIVTGKAEPHPNNVRMLADVIGVDVEELQREDTE